MHSRFCCESVAKSAENSLFFGQRVRESKPISTFRKLARLRRKPATISALTASVAKRPLHESRRFTQFECPNLSENVLRVRPDGNWVGAVRKSNNGVTFPINSIFSRAATFESGWVYFFRNP